MKQLKSQYNGNSCDKLPHARDRGETRGFEFEDWIKPCEEEMEKLKKLKSKMVTVSLAGAMWLKGELEQRLETELMPMFRDAMPND